MHISLWSQQVDAIILIYILKIHYELIICNDDNSLIERKDYIIQYSFLFYMYSMTGIAGNDKNSI